MKDLLLEIDVRLLVLRYGRQRVIEVLARLGEQTTEELEQQLRELEQRPKPNRAKRARLSLVDIAASECRDRPEISESLRTIAVRFENRTLLPNLRDVYRFLDQIGASRNKLKSRALAGQVLVRALAKLPLEEVAKLASKDMPSGESDYSLLSRAIMGTSASRDKE